MGLKLLDNLKNALRDNRQDGQNGDDLYGDDYYGGNAYGDGDGVSDGIGDAGDDAVSLFDSPEEQQSANTGYGGAAPAKPAAGASLRVVKPTSYADGPDIADKLMDGSTVVLNLEEMNKESAIRLIDFLLGVSHVLDADMKKVSANTIVIAPGGIEESGEDDSYHA